MYKLQVHVQIYVNCIYRSISLYGILNYPALSSAFQLFVEYFGFHTTALAMHTAYAAFRYALQKWKSNSV